jgi:hypothetical protein
MLLRLAIPYVVVTRQENATVSVRVATPSHFFQVEDGRYERHERSNNHRR